MVLADGGTSAGPLTLCPGHCTALVTGATRVPAAKPPSLAKGLLVHRGRSALLALGWEGTCSYEDGRLSLPLALSSELKT